ncbi:hypothetical protein F5I97DRAFT_1603704 [Phlebopus sp. FC_14]|nr:hypothetical protein F5I97DRAFT_1603704 [Phlebopus sp. FC_14]
MSAQEVDPSSQDGDLLDDYPSLMSPDQRHSPIALDPPTAGPIIAIDLDDVLSDTNALVSEWHNKNYSTEGEMNLSNFYYYYYWKNPYWGPPATTHAKVKQFYQSNWIETVPPVPGAREGIEALRLLGYRLIIVTARGQHVQADSWIWVQRWFPSCFESIICTGQFANSPKAAPDGVNALPHAKKAHEIATKLTKAQVCIDLGAKLLIDDSMENAMTCALHPSDNENRPPLVLLFGSYEWNKRISHSSDECEEMVYKNRAEREGGTEFLERDIIRGTEALAQANARELRIKRVKDWSDVLWYVTEEKNAGRL